MGCMGIIILIEFCGETDLEFIFSKLSVLSCFIDLFKNEDTSELMLGLGLDLCVKPKVGAEASFSSSLLITFSLLES